MEPMRHRAFLVRFAFVLAVGAALCAAPMAAAQEAEHEADAAHTAEAEELVFRHFVSFFGGLATYTDVGTTGGAMGISYAYKFSHRWAGGVKLEYVTSDIERDIVALAGVTFEPVERLEFGAAYGVEFVAKDEAEEGSILTETESEGLLRLGVGYKFRLREGVAVLPEFNTDISSHRVTLVYGLVFSVGL